MAVDKSRLSFLNVKKQPVLTRFINCWVMGWIDMVELKCLISHIISSSLMNSGLVITWFHLGNRCREQAARFVMDQ